MYPPWSVQWVVSDKGIGGDWPSRTKGFEWAKCGCVPLLQCIHEVFHQQANMHCTRLPPHCSSASRDLLYTLL